MCQEKRVSSFCELCLARGYSTRTIRAYAYDLVIFFRFHRGKRLQFPDFERVTVKTLVDFFLAEKKRNAAPRSINRRINTVDMFYRHCFAKLIPGTQSIGTSPKSMSRRRFLTMDSTLGVFAIYAKSGSTLRVREPRSLVATLEAAETEKFFSTLKTYRDRAIVALMLVCGLRSMEVIGLKKDDANALSQTLRIRGKGSKERIIPLPAPVRELLDRYIEAERPVRPGLENEHYPVNLCVLVLGFWSLSFFLGSESFGL